MRALIILVLLSTIIYSQTKIEFIPINGIKDTSIRQQTFNEFLSDYASISDSSGLLAVSHAWSKFAPIIKPKFTAIATDSSLLFIDLGCNENGGVEKIIYNAHNLDGKSVEDILANYFRDNKFAENINRKYSQCGSFLFNSHLVNK